MLFDGHEVTSFNVSVQLVMLDSSPEHCVLTLANKWVGSKSGKRFTRATAPVQINSMTRNSPLFQEVVLVVK